MFSFPDRWGMGELAIRRPGRHYSPPTMPRYHDTISGCVDSNSKIGNRACRSRGTASSRSHEDIKCNVFNFSFMTFSSPVLLLPGWAPLSTSFQSPLRQSRVSKFSVILCSFFVSFQSSNSCTKFPRRF